MLKTYVGPEAARVVVAGQDFGTVEPGDSIVIDDDLANSVAWPEDNWQDKKTKKSDKKASKDDSSEDGNSDDGSAADNTAEDGGN